MSVRRCQHDVMFPSWCESDVNPYCSGCSVPDPLPPGGQLAVNRQIYFPYGKTKCPKCGSKKFKWVSDWDFHCSNCNCDALDF